MPFCLTRSTRATACSTVSRIVSSPTYPSSRLSQSRASPWTFPQVNIRERGAEVSGRRGFASEGSQLVQLLQNELQHESANYQDNSETKKFLASGDWKLEEKEGDVNMVLRKSAQDKKITVEFQLVSPFESDENGGEEAAEAAPESEMTDFSVTVESGKGQGVTFYCSTVQGGEDNNYRYMIGNVRYFATEAEKNSASAYNGPEFEDLDDSLQQALDDWLASLGVNESLCDFIDAMSVDKEQREYMRWIGKLSSFVQSS